MATSTGKAICVKCEKERNAVCCRGCSQDFCFDHIDEHHKTFTQLFTEIQCMCNLFKQSIIEHKQDITKCSLIQQVNQWENDGINKIKEKAKETRELLFTYTNKSIDEIENKFKRLTNSLEEFRQENDLNELELNQLKIKLTKLKEELDNPSDVSIIEKSTSFLNNIFLSVPRELTTFSNVNLNTIWKQNGRTVAGGNGKGEELGQLCSPQGICIDDDQTIYIADWLNHRIIAWKNHENSGQIVAGGNGEGHRNNQLKHPTSVIIDKETNSIIIADRGNRRVVRCSRKNSSTGEIIIPDIDCWGLAMDKNGYIYTSDTVKHEVKKWRIGETDGTVVAGGNSEGNRLNQLNFPSYIFVDEEYSVYVSDDHNHRVMKWMKDVEEGIIVAGERYWGNTLKQLYFPQGIVVDQSGQIYIADCDNHRV